MKILIVSNNKDKINEIKTILKKDVYSLRDLDLEIELQEDKSTFRENALSKAIQLYNIVGSKYICIADDSGLVIDSLNGFPGVKTHRWIDLPDDLKNKKLIEMVKDKDRTCHYINSFAIKSKDIEEVVEYSLRGVIAEKERGNNGFGFDPIFEVNGKTLAELTKEEKLSISPRKKCLEDIKKLI